MYYIILLVITAIMVIVANKSSMLRNELLIKITFASWPMTKALKMPGLRLALGAHSWLSGRLLLFRLL